MPATERAIDLAGVDRSVDVTLVLSLNVNLQVQPLIQRAITSAQATAMRVHFKRHDV